MTSTTSGACTTDGFGGCRYPLWPDITRLNCVVYPFIGDGDSEIRQTWQIYCPSSRGFAAGLSAPSGSSNGFDSSGLWVPFWATFWVWFPLWDWTSGTFFAPCSNWIWCSRFSTGFLYLHAPFLHTETLHNKHTCPLLWNVMQVAKVVSGSSLGRGGPACMCLWRSTQQRLSDVIWKDSRLGNKLLIGDWTCSQA